MTELKRLMAEFEAAEKESDRIDELWEEDYENEELEAEWTAAYKAETSAREKLQDALVKLTNEAVDGKTARMMIYAKRAELKALIEST